MSKGIKEIVNGDYILYIPVKVEEGKPDQVGEISLTSKYPIGQWWTVEEFLDVVDPRQMKELAIQEKKELEERIKLLNKVLED